MNIFKKHATMAIAVALIIMPALALAQSYDNESAEGSCADEMSEGMTCGGSYNTGSSYTAPSYNTYTAPTQYNPTQNYSSYTTPTSPNSYSSYAPSMYS